jgi:hypothetical protein
LEKRGSESIPKQNQLKKKVIRAIENARARIKQGMFLTECGARKKLRL